MISGITKLAITKLDVLNGLSQVYICTQYQLEGKRIDYVPANIEVFTACKPVYKEFKGWETIDQNTKTFEELPKEAQTYLKFIEKETGVPINLVSIGPGRTETIEVPKQVLLL